MPLFELRRHLFTVASRTLSGPMYSRLIVAPINFSRLVGACQDRHQCEPFVASGSSWIILRGFELMISHSMMSRANPFIFHRTLTGMPFPFARLNASISPPVRAILVSFRGPWKSFLFARSCCKRLCMMPLLKLLMFGFGHHRVGAFSSCGHIITPRYNNSSSPKNVKSVRFSN